MTPEDTTFVLKDTELFDPSTGVQRRCDVVVRNGRITLRGKNLDGPPGVRTIDCSGLWLWPGLVDPHVHFRDPGFTWKEDLRTGSSAAAAGGYTAVVCEPNTDPPLDQHDVIRKLADRAAEEACVRIYLKAAMTEGRSGRRLTDFASLSEIESVVALSDDGDPVVDPEVMENVCRRAAALDLLLSPHCEDSPQALDTYDGGSEPGFSPGAAYTNESAYIARDLKLASRHGCRIHFSHVSLRRSVEHIRSHRRSAGEPASRVTFEAAPHHLLLCADDYAEGSIPKVCPPLRSASDRDALVEAVSEGEVDAIASDHAPHSREDKEAGASGLIGLETTLGLVLTHLVSTNVVEPIRAAELLSTAPARIFGLPAGSLEPGAAADMVLIDPEREWTVDAEVMHSKSANCPYDGWRLRGRAAATFVGGKRVYEDEGFADRCRPSP